MAVGLGSGSTAAYVTRGLGERVRQGLRVRAIPTSRETERLARSCGIPLTTFEKTIHLDLTVDGADAIDPSLRLLKGRGGALLREKMVAAASDEWVIVADASKLVPVLCGPVPIEIIPFGHARVAHALAQLGGTPALRLDARGNPFVTDESHWIVDTDFGEILDPESLGDSLDGISGVVEHGLFLGMASSVIVADGLETRVLAPPTPRERSS